MHFVELLNECEGNNCFMFNFEHFVIGITDPDHLTLEEVLIFFTGSDVVPPLGYYSEPILTFDNTELPTASTCALTLTLPLNHQTYLSFKDKVTFSMKNHGGFGLL